MDKPTAKGDAERPATGSLDKSKRADSIDDLDDIAPVYRPEGGSIGAGSDRSLMRPVGLVLLGALLLLIIFAVARCSSSDNADSSNESSSTEATSDSSNPSDTSDAATSGSATGDADDDDSQAGSDPSDEDASTDGDADGDPAQDEESDAGQDDTGTAEGGDDTTTADASGSESDAWSMNTAAGDAAPSAIAASETFGSESWAVSPSGGLHLYSTESGWTQRQDPLLADLIVSDLSHDADGLTVLVTQGELGAAVGVTGPSVGEFAWKPFELPADTPVPDLLASGDAGHLVAHSDGEPADLLRNQDAAALLVTGGIELGPEWIAGADTEGVTYLDPSVPLSDWASALPTTTRWDAFGIERPQWAAYGGATGEPERVMFLVTSESVIEIGDPFGPQEFLVELNSNDGSFEAITWDGSGVTGPKLWESADAQTWQAVGPTTFSGATLTHAIDGAGITAGEHEYRLRSLGSRPPILDYRPTGGDWSPAPLSQLSGSTLNSSYVADRLLIGPSALVIGATHADTGAGVVLLSRDGETWETVDPGIEIDSIVIADTYVLIADREGASVRLTPVG